MILFRNCPFLFAVTLLAVMSIAFPSFSYDIQVTKTEDTNDGICDENDCSLREAIIKVNNTSSQDSGIIHVPAGRYFITSPGYDDEAATGDLDITNSVTIIGEGMDATKINALGSWGVHERVFHVNTPGQEVRFENLGIFGGYDASTGIGGGVLITGATKVSFFRCHLYGNYARYGGAIYFRNDVSTSNTLTITECVVERNEALLIGGGIDVKHINLLIDGSTITGNSASQHSGGLAADSIHTEIINSTFYKNAAPQGSEMSFSGIGLGLFSHSTLVSSFSNFEEGKNIINSGGYSSLAFYNSIVWGKCFPETLAGFSTFGGNMGEPLNTCGLGEGDIILDTDPILLPLGDYGGPTPTAPPAFRSIAIDNGIYCERFEPLSFDQRGVTRPQSGDCNAIKEWDIGSVERECIEDVIKRLLKDLGYMVKDPSILTGIKKSLSYMVANADKSYDRGRFRTAINQLKALNNSVEAQREKALANTQADNIILLSNEAIMFLENEVG